MDPEQAPAVGEQGREQIRMAVGILIERYGVPGETAESALMDWSRISEVGVHDLAARVVDDARRGGRPEA